MSKGKHSRTRGREAPAPGAGHKRPLPSPDWVVVALAAVGLAVSGYLAVLALTGSQALFCLEGSACDLVQNSRFSRFLGVPVAVWGFALYAAIALIAWRMPAQLKRWRRLWGLAVLGVTVSLYLTVTGIVALDSVCGWCLVSLTTISAILVAVALRRHGSAPGMPWARWLSSSAIAMATVAAVMAVSHSDLLQGRETPRLQALAIHLEESGAKFYGAFWCPNCQQQKRLFGASADRLPYVECNPNGRGGAVALVCLSENIQGYPTWIIGGQRFQEVLTPEDLARYSGFRWRAEATE